MNISTKSVREHSLRVALVQMNATVGALDDNARRIAELAHGAASAGAGVIVFPELILSGYPPEGLVRKHDFLKDCAKTVRELAKALPSDPVVIVGAPLRERSGVFNAAFVFQGGRVRGIHRKVRLSQSEAVDERGLFSAGASPTVLNLGGLRLGLQIGDDGFDSSPGEAFRAAGVSAVLNLAAPVYRRGALKVRTKSLARLARLVGAPVACVHLVGGQDELVFDGASIALDSNGRVLARARQFAEETLFAELPTIGKKATRISKGWKCETIALPRVGNGAGAAWKNRRASLLGELEEVYSALRLGLRDYVEKNCFSKVVLGLSGGVDSALVAAICVDALGADRVVGVTMPSRFTSGETLDDAARLAKNLGVELLTIPIQTLHRAYLDEFAPLWPGRLPDATEENVQARIRANALMALSNKFGWLAVTTGNRSEVATGYCTLYGDMAGGFSLIKDVPKTLVWALARWRNASGVVIPPSTIERAPSAELSAGQRDQDTLPPYEVLDEIIERYAERDWGVDEIVADGFDAATVKRTVRMIDQCEYKRRQAAPGVTLTPWVFAPGRRVPVTNRYGK